MTWFGVSALASSPLAMVVIILGWVVMVALAAKTLTLLTRSTHTPLDPPRASRRALDLRFAAGLIGEREYVRARHQVIGRKDA